ncbi:nSTAND1 domain-containing NTPase [Nostoc sp.]|uniref:nSTAND1 domain-containing NTPase n=1 Tax=Nostoc sp. TaxID=1180 RepID=UPI002FF99DB6
MSQTNQNSTGNDNQNVVNADKSLVAKDISGGIYYQCIFNQPEDTIKQRLLISSSPYKGLRNFDAGDREKFFGREKLITSCWEQLQERKIILLLGASGSGKSSLVQAGVIPKFLDQKFRHLIFSPYTNPFKSLASCLYTQKYARESEIAEKEESDTLIRVVDALTKDAQWLIFIDQFEEIFTGSDKEKAKKFIDSIVQLIEAQKDSVKIILAMRNDFLDEFTRYPNLGYATQSHVFMMLAMEDYELEEAIAEPAAKNGVVFDTGLRNKIIRDFKEHAGSLPLLQYTLDLLWEKNNITERKLKKNTYEELGGVGGALQKQAEEIYKKLKEDEQKAAKEIFISLVDIIDDKAVSRRSEKANFENSRVLESTLNKLISERLLVAQGGEGQEPTVEVAHEILLISWSRLQEWIEAAKETLALKRRLLEDAKAWSDLQSKNDKNANQILWSGNKLKQVLELKIELLFKNIKNEEVNRFLATSKLQEQSSQMLSPLSLLKMQPLDALMLAMKLFGENLDELPSILDSVESCLRNAMELDINSISYQGHSAPVTSVAFSPDGQRIVSASSDSTIRLWEIRINPISKSFQGNIAPVGSVAFSPNGDMIVSASADKTVRLWDISGNPIGEPLRGHTEPVHSVAFSPNGGMIASGSADKTVRLWDISGNPIGEPLRGHTEPVHSVAFSPNGDMIVSSSADKRVRLWDISGNPIGEPLRGHTEPVCSVAFSPNGDIIVSGGYDKTVRLWDISGNPIGEPLHGHTEPVGSVAFSPNGDMIVSGGYDRTVRLWDIKGKPIGKALCGHLAPVGSVAFSPNGDMIVSASADKTVRLWDISRKVATEPEPFSGHTVQILSVAFSPNGDMIASSSADKTVRLWDISGNPIGEPLRGHTESVCSVAFSPNGDIIVSGGYDKTVRLWDISGNPIGEPLHGHTEPVGSVAFSPNGDMIVSASADKTVRLWDISGSPIGEPLRGHTEPVHSVAFSPNGDMIVSGGYDNKVRLWDISGSPIGEPLCGHSDPILSVAFSPNGDMIVSGSVDKTVRLWDISGNPIGEPLHGHTEPVRSVAFSPNGGMIASGGYDNTVRLWDISGKLIFETFLGFVGLGSVAFSPNGQIIAAGGYDTVHLLPLKSQECLSLCCQKLRDYCVFQNPEKSSLAEAVWQICEKYV